MRAASSTCRSSTVTSLGLRRLAAQLEDVERRAGVAAGPAGDPPRRAPPAARASRSAAPRRTIDCQVLARQRLELVDLGAREERRVDLEVRVLGRRSDQRHEPRLDGGQQRVLLGLVEAVDLVEEEDRALPGAAEPLTRPLEDGADVGDCGRDGRQLLECRARRRGDDARERRLPASRRPVEDGRATRSSAIASASADPGPTTCSWPTKSSRRAGAGAGRAAPLGQAAPAASEKRSLMPEVCSAAREGPPPARGVLDHVPFLSDGESREHGAARWDGARERRARARAGYWACAVRTEDGGSRSPPAASRSARPTSPGRPARPRRIAEVFALMPGRPPRAARRRAAVRAARVAWRWSGARRRAGAPRDRVSARARRSLGAAPLARARHGRPARLDARRLPRRRAHLDRQLRARRAAQREHERCGSHLVGPLLVTSAAREPPRAARPAAAPRRSPGSAAAVGAHGRVGRALLAGWCETSGHPRRPGARQPGPRAAAPHPHRRAHAGAARGRAGGARRMPAPRIGAQMARSRRAPRRSASRLRSSTSRSRRCGRATTPTSTSTTRATCCSPTAATRTSSCRSSRRSTRCSAGWTRRSRSSSSARTTGTALTVHALYDGDEIAPWETVLTIEGDYTLFAHLETLVPGRARPADARLDQHEPGRRGGARQADPLLPGPARPPSRADRRRLRGARRGRDRRLHRRAGVLVGRPGHRHRAARADRAPTAANTVLAATKFAEPPSRTMNIIVLVDFENDSVRTAARGRPRARRPRSGACGSTRPRRSSTARSGPRWATSTLAGSTRGWSEGAGTRSTRRASSECKIVVSGGFDAERIQRLRGAAACRSTPTASARRSSAARTTSRRDVVLTDGQPSAKVGRALRPNERLELTWL